MKRGRQYPLAHDSLHFSKGNTVGNRISREQLSLLSSDKIVLLLHEWMDYVGWLPPVPWLES
jgi:thiamine pyrophosphokinase